MGIMVLKKVVIGHLPNQVEAERLLTTSNRLVLFLPVQRSVTSNSFIGLVFDRKKKVKGKKGVYRRRRGMVSKIESSIRDDIFTQKLSIQ